MKKILVVDDDPIVRKVFRGVLEYEGYEVYELNSGVDVVSMTREKGIDLIILDIYMEEEEGIGILVKIRNVFKEHPIIIISSDNCFFDIAQQLGANKTLQKPIFGHELVSSIKEFLVD